MPDPIPEVRPTNTSPAPRWRLRLVKADGSHEAERYFYDLRSLLAAAARFRKEFLDVRLIITVPLEASQEDRDIVGQIASRVPRNPI